MFLTNGCIEFRAMQAPLYFTSSSSACLMVEAWCLTLKPHPIFLHCLGGMFSSVIEAAC